MRTAETAAMASAIETKNDSPMPNGKRRRFRSIKSKISALVVIVLILCAVIITAISFTIIFLTALEHKTSTLKAAAYAGSIVIDPEQYRILDETGEKNDYYYKTSAKLAEIRTASEVSMLYSMKYVDESYKYIIDSMLPEDFPDWASDLGDIDDIENYGEEALTALRTGEMQVTKIYDGGDWGMLLSAFAPIFDDGGAVIGIVGADMTLSDIINDLIRNALIFLSIILTLCVVMAFVSRAYVKRIVGEPLRRLSEESMKLADGDTRINLDLVSNDEIGLLCDNFRIVGHEVNKLVSEVHGMAVRYNRGDLDALIAADGFKGAYLEMSAGINEMSTSMTRTLREVLEIIHGFGRGKFDAKLPPYPGKKAVVNEAVDLVSKNLQTISGNIQHIIGSVSQGQLQNREDVSGYEGGWLNIIEGLNDVMDAVAAPITEAKETLRRLSEGDLTAKMRAEYSGDYAEMKAALNHTVDTIRMSVSDVDRVLTGIAENNLNQYVEGEYPGDFGKIKNAMVRILDTLNSVVSDIHNASENVKVGSEEISQSGMKLANGASDQASALMELSGSAEEINSQTALNTADAGSMRAISAASKENAELCGAKMDELSEAMSGIREAAQNIAGIIRLIDGIAFQTNLLAINAAIEAARAGTHGKGFGVVADEVKSLSERSKNAAKDTDELINATVEKVTRGSAAAADTAEALKQIITDIDSIVEITGRMASSSGEQARAITKMNDRIREISDVVRDNTSAAEESAAASTQLHTQSDKLNEMVETFELR